MSAIANTSIEAGGIKTNSLVCWYNLNPKIFFRGDAHAVSDILKHICALRNSGGGMLNIWFTETFSTSEAEKCVDKIKMVADKHLSDTEKADLLEWKFSNRIKFLIKSSKEIVTMKYNMYVMTNGVAKLVPPSKSAAEVRSLLHGRKEQPSMKYDMNVVTNEVAKPVPSTKPASLARSLLHGRNEQPTTKCDINVVTYEVAKLVPSTKPASLARSLLHGRKEQPTTKYDIKVVTYEVAKLVFLLHSRKEQPTTECDMNVVANVAKPVPSTQSEWRSRLDFHEKTRKEQQNDSTEPIMQAGSHKRSRSVSFGGTGECLTNCTTMQHTLISHWSSPIMRFVEGKRAKIPTKYASKQMIRFEVLKNTSGTEKSVANLMLSDENNLCARVLRLNNRHGGHVYYGISSDGIVCGVKVNTDDEKRMLKRSVKKKIKSMMVDEIHGTWNVNVYLKRVNKNIGKEYIPNLFVIGIYVPPFARVVRSGFHPSPATASFQLDSISFICSPEGKIEKIFLDQDELVKLKQVKVPTTKLSHETVKYKVLEDDKLSSIPNNVAHLITLDENELLTYVSAFANHHGGELYYGIDSNGTVFGEIIYESAEMEKVHEEVEKEIASMVWPRHVNKIHKFWKITFLPVKDQAAFHRDLYVIKISVNPCSGGVFVQDPESYHVVENRVEKLPFSTWSACLQDSTTEVLHTTAFVEFKEGEKAFDRLLLPTDYQTLLKGLEWVKSFKIVDANKECNERHLEIVLKFGKVPCTHDIVKYFGEEILPFITYQEYSKREWFEKNLFDENSEMKKDYEKKLTRLEWVESFKIIDATEECNERHLEIVCTLGKIPCTDDIVVLFGEEILPFITYQECSKREWFETNIFDENYTMKKEYKSELTSLSWVKDFYIGVASEPEKSWQIYITYAQNNAPPMVDLKKLFGVNIASFVEFIQESEDDKEPLPPPRYLRGPRSGDKLCARPENEGGTIGILTADKKHYATTCYHSCFNADVPKNIRELSMQEIHELLKKDYENESSKGCQGTCIRVYTAENPKQDESQYRNQSIIREYTTEKPKVGQFKYGLYDDDHDIAFVELEPSLNCIDAVNFLRQESIKPKLANNKEVADMLFKMGKLPVKKFGAITKTTEGEFFAIDSAPLFGTTIEIAYRIKGIHGQTFAMEGDSGSLVCLVYNNERKPFGYLCSEVPQHDKSAVYGCRNLNHSIKELIRRRNLSDIQPCFNNNH